MLNDTDDIQGILVELPADAQNLQVEQISNDGNSTDITGQVLEINESDMTGNQTSDEDSPEMSLAEIAHMFNATEVIPLDLAKMDGLKEIKQEDKPTKILFINETNDRKSSDKDKKEKQAKSDKNERANVRGFNNNVEVISSSNTNTNDESIIIENSTEYQIKFTTQAPNATEIDYSTETKFQRNVTISHNSTLHYTNVKSYSDIPENLVEHNVQFKLNWVINNTKVDVTNDPRFNVTFVDTNGNNIADRMEWIVPQLSEQEFEIEADIEIINVQSYPVVGGKWTVNFNTTGIADLTITGIMGTTFGESLPDDLKFLELNNGTHTLAPIINLTANTITYHNYTSNMTGFEASKVLTPGDHHLMFQFGNDVGFAHNFAKVEELQISTGRFQITGGTGTQDITGVGFQPKAYILITTTGNVDDNDGTHSRLSIGMTDGANEFCMSSGGEDNVGSPDVGRHGAGDEVLCSYDLSGSPNASVAAVVMLKLLFVA